MTRSSKCKRNFRLTDRDYKVLKAVNRYRYLRTGQIKRLLFPGSSTPQTARRRLRYLSNPGFRYLGKIKPYVQIGNGNAESAWFLDRGGEELLRAHGVELISYSRKNSGRVKHHFLAHSLDISEFRLNLELALTGHPLARLHRFVADFEIKERTGTAIGPNAYKLYHELRHPVARNQTYTVYPDALLVLRGKGEYESFQRLFFLEVDRGTESLSVVRDKAIGYGLYRDQGVYKKFGKFDGFRVLLQTTSPKRSENIRNALVGTEGNDLLWITDHPRVTQKTILSKPIWSDHEGNLRSIVKGEEA